MNENVHMHAGQQLSEQGTYKPHEILMFVYGRLV